VDLSLVGPVTCILLDAAPARAGRNATMAFGEPAGKRAVLASEYSAMLLCQISDLHVMSGRALAYGVVDTAACLERCVRAHRSAWTRCRPGRCHGRLVDMPDAMSYGVLRGDSGEAASAGLSACPAITTSARRCAPRFRTIATFPREGAPSCSTAGRLSTRSDVAGARHRDTRQPEGTLCARRLHWLQQRLDESDAPTGDRAAPPAVVTGIATWTRWGWTTRPGCDDRAPLSAGPAHRVRSPAPSDPGDGSPERWPRSARSAAHQVLLDLKRAARPGS